MRGLPILAFLVTFGSCSRLDTEFIISNETDATIDSIWIAPFGQKKPGDRQLLRLAPGASATYELAESYWFESDPLIIYYQQNQTQRDLSFAYAHHSVSIGRGVETENLIEIVRDSVLIRYYKSKTH